MSGISTDYRQVSLSIYSIIIIHHPAFLPLTHNGCRKISVVYEWIMKIEVFSSPFWFAMDEGYPPRPLFVKTIRDLFVFLFANLSYQ